MKTHRNLAVILIALATGATVTACHREDMAKTSRTTTTAQTTTPVTNGVTTPATDAANVNPTITAETILPDGTAMSPADAATTEKIKTAMLADPEVQIQHVAVRTQDGVVTLSGVTQTR